MPLESPCKILAAAATAPESAALERDLIAAGLDVKGVTTCSALVHAVPEMKPDAIVLRIAQPRPAFLAALAEWLPRAPCPLIVFADASDGDTTRQAISLGIHAWIVGGYAPDRIGSVLQVAHARWVRENAQREQTEALRRQLDERKWVERAKGVLMAAQEIGEDEAYKLLRTAAMQRQARLGDVSRTVIDASHWAEAVNRAGQLRMLSQRLVRVFAQRVARAGVRRAVALQDEATRRTRDNIARLDVLVPDPLRASALAPVVDAWTALQAALEQRATAAAVGQADACAEVLLEAAHRLTHALEVASGRRALYIVNLSGRQRMLAQRVAKEMMLALATDRLPAVSPLTVTVKQFETALNELDQAPLSSDAIRAGLAAAREEWSRMMHGVSELDRRDGRLACAAASDALVLIFDRVTDHYQRSLQALMG